MLSLSDNNQSDSIEMFKTYILCYALSLSNMEVQYT